MELWIITQVVYTITWSTKNKSKENTIINNAKDISRMCSTSIKNGIKALSYIVPEINILLSPILYPVDNTQKKRKMWGINKSENIGSRLLECILMYEWKNRAFTHRWRLCLHIHRSSKAVKKIEYLTKAQVNISIHVKMIQTSHSNSSQFPLQ